MMVKRHALHLFRMDLTFTALSSQEPSGQALAPPWFQEVNLG